MLKTLFKKETVLIYGNKGSYGDEKVEYYNGYSIEAVMNIAKDRGIYYNKNYDITIASYVKVFNRWYFNMKGKTNDLLFWDCTVRRCTR